MVVQELLNQIQELGYKVELVADNIRFTYTRGNQTPKEAIPILTQVKKFKREVVAYLRKESNEFWTEREALSERMAIQGENCGEGETKPYISAFNTLIIPWNSPKRYWYWAGGQSICCTLKQLGRCDLIPKYSDN